MDNQNFGNIDQKNFKVNVYKSPIAAAIWSACLPGFGQFYVRDFAIAVVLGIWEISINIMSRVNWSIFYSFTGELQKSYEVVDWGWGLFYPSVYVFNIWHAYDRAKVINSELEERGVPRPEKLANNVGFFTGLFLGMFFGIHWNFLTSPVFSGLALGVLFGALGHVLEILYYRNKKKSAH